MYIEVKGKCTMKKRNFFKHITFTILNLISILIISSVKFTFHHLIVINIEI